MFCKNCGTLIEEGQKFCSKCGAEVVTEQPDSENVQSKPASVASENLDLPKADSSSSKNASKGNEQNIEGYVYDFASKLCSGYRLPIAMILVIVISILRFFALGQYSYSYEEAIYDMARGRHSCEGTLYEIGNSITELIPWWLISIMFQLAVLYLFMFLVDVTRKLKVKTLWIYSLPILWGFAAIMLLITQLVNEDLKLVRIVLLLVDVLIIIDGFIIKKIEGFSLLSKMTIIYGFFALIDLFSTSIAMSVLYMLVTIVFCIIFRKVLSPIYGRLEKSK